MNTFTRKKVINISVSGTIRLFFRLTLFGAYIVSDYQLYADSCIFKNELDGELRITKIVEENPDEDDGRIFKLTEGTVLAAFQSEKSKKDTE